MEESKPLSLDRTETKEYLEKEIQYALNSFSSDLRCYIDNGVKVGVSPDALNELEYLIMALARSIRVVERATLPVQFSFPGNSW